ncbi:hypothetical protein COO60DRAFT_1018160 [Scenedesmus sp. NREL 46B-D3]|nr:hypothetical protein COO60DRAFT_1018160 [Scenedesmus sp. NREL 46B-D3]
MMVPLKACLLAVVAVLITLSASEPQLHQFTGPIAAHSPAVRACCCTSASCNGSSATYTAQQLNAHDLRGRVCIVVFLAAACVLYRELKWLLAFLPSKGLHLRWRVAVHLLGLLVCVLTGGADDAALAAYQALTLDNNEGKFYGLQDSVTELEAKCTHKVDEMSPGVLNPLYEPCEAPCRPSAADTKPVLCHQDRNPTVLAPDDAGSINAVPSSSAAAATPATRQRRRWDLPQKTLRNGTTQQSMPRWCSPQAPAGTAAQDSRRPVVSSSSSSSSSSSTDDHKSSSNSRRSVSSITRSSSSSSSSSSVSGITRRSSKSSSSQGFSAAQPPVRFVSGLSKLAARSSSTYTRKQPAAAAAAAAGGRGLDAAGKAADTGKKCADRPVWK